MYENGSNGQRVFQRDLNGQPIWSYTPPGGTGLPSDTEVYIDGDWIGAWQDGSLVFTGKDWIGTKRYESVGSGSSISEVTPITFNSYTSLPFGDNLSSIGQDATHFTGKERDTPSGLDYFGARYYSSTMGRWMSPDPSGLTYADIGNPQSLNLYNYVGNNPLTRADLDGLCWKGFQWACNLGQRLRNLAEGDGFRTDYQNALHPGKASQRDREKSLMRELGESDPGNILRSLFCAASSNLLTAANISNSTVGRGVGGNAGAGLLFGYGVSAGVQQVADSHGNLGIAFNSGFSPGIGVLGFGAIAGGQVSISQVKTIDQLSGTSTDFGGSAGEGPAVGLDVAVDDEGNKTGTVTAGPGVGTKGAAMAIQHTWVPRALSTNCGGG